MLLVCYCCMWSLWIIWTEGGSPTWGHCRICQTSVRSQIIITQKKKEEPKPLLRHVRGTVFVRRTDPFVALFWLFFFLSGAVFPLKSAFEAPFLTFFFRKRWTLFAKRSHFPKRFFWGTSLAPLFSEWLLHVQATYRIWKKNFTCWNYNTGARTIPVYRTKTLCHITNQAKMWACTDITPYKILGWAVC